MRYELCRHLAVLSSDLCVLKFNTKHLIQMQLAKKCSILTQCNALQYAFSALQSLNSLIVQEIWAGKLTIWYDTIAFTKKWTFTFFIRNVSITFRKKCCYMTPQKLTFCWKWRIIVVLSTNCIKEHVPWPRYTQQSFSRDVFWTRIVKDKTKNVAWRKSRRTYIEVANTLLL